MAAAVSTTPRVKVTPRGANFNNPRRQLEAEDNAPPRRTKSREMITSRYLSSSLSSSRTNSTSTSSASSNTSSSFNSSPSSISSYRSQSPIAKRTAASNITPVATLSTIKRSQSVERRRPQAANPMEISNAARLLMRSTRSLSVSFQGESLCSTHRKPKPAPSPAVASNLSTVRRITPERRKSPAPAKDQSENFKVPDQQRWPARSRPLTPSMLTRSLDYGTDKPKLRGSASLISSLQKSMLTENYGKITSSAKLKDDGGLTKLRNKIELTNDVDSLSVPAKQADEDSDSVSSGGSLTRVRGVPRGIVVPARFLQETNSRSGLKTIPSGKLFGAKKLMNEGSESSPRGISSSRGSASPLRGGSRPSSPSKTFGSPLNYPASRGMPSPTRTRNGATTMSSNKVCNSPSILCFTADLKRGRVGENLAVAHELRLLYNRHLQWRFTKARAETALLLQKETAERSLYNAWVATSRLRHAVKSKRIQLQRLSQNLKLYSILKGQVPYLESCDLIQTDHCSSLSGTSKALEASIVHLPLVAGARADTQHVNKAICSAADVMQAMVSSICSEMTKVEQVNLLASELANLTANERALLAKCKNLLSTLTSMQVNDYSLRTHLLLIKNDLQA